MAAITATSASTDPQDTGQANSPRHLSSVAALRGWAALLVVLFHLMLVPYPPLAASPYITPLILAGGSGVGLFFVVSAFTLCLSSSSRKEKSYPLLSFYLRRIFRIVPLYYVLLTTTVLRDRLIFGIHHSRIDILRCLVFGYNVVPGKNEGIVQASWTLGVEMIFYLLFPFIFRIVNTLPKAICLFLITCVTALGFENVVKSSSLPSAQKASFFHFSFLHSLPAFAAGVVVFFMYKIWIENKKTNKQIAWYLLLGSLAAHVVLAYSGVIRIEADFYWHAIMYSTLLISLIVVPVRSIVNRITEWYGTISYSVYLNHPVCLWLLGPLYPKFYHHLPSTLAFIGCFALTLAILTPLSYVTYKFIEEPGIRLGSLLIKRLPTIRHASSSVN